MVGSSSYALAAAQPFEPKGECQIATRSDTTRSATVLFVDMIGFTRFCAENDPSLVCKMLKDLLGLLTREVLRHGGRVEKLLGDGLMAVFDRREPEARDASRALTAAGAITVAMGLWNAERLSEDCDPIKVGIGIHSGPVIVDSIVSVRRSCFRTVERAEL